MDDSTIKSVNDRTPSGRSRQRDADAQPNPLSFKKRQSFTSVNHVLNKLVSHLGLDRRLKEHALMDMWSAVAGELLSKRSRPLFLDTEGNLVIAVKDASTGQELSLQKVDLAQKLRPFARAIGINVKGLRFDLKHFHAQKVAEALQTPKKLPQRPNEAQIAQINLTAEDLSQVAELRANLDETANIALHICDKIVAAFERELRLKHWRQSAGLPICGNCNEPAESLHGNDQICRDCYFEKASKRGDI